MKFNNLASIALASTCLISHAEAQESQEAQEAHTSIQQVIEVIKNNREDFNRASIFNGFNAAIVYLDGDYSIQDANKKGIQLEQLLNSNNLNTCAITDNFTKDFQYKIICK